nr:hypothetical protein [Tanacetum cinerariifolium]
MIEPKEFIYYRMETEENNERYIAPCFVNMHSVPDGEINLGNYENLISSNLAARLFLKLKDKRGDKVELGKLLVCIKGEVYHVKFIVNPNDGDLTPGIVMGRSFLKTSRGIVNLRKEVMSIYPDLDPFHDNSYQTILEMNGMIY